MKILDLKQIKSIVSNFEVSEILKVIESGFVAYSCNQSVVPPVGELLMQDPPGEVHIKYGYLKDDDYYVVKIASGFYDNATLNLPSSNGLMLLFNQKTGELQCILLDEGYLTDIRTAMAGAISAKYLAPKKVNCIGIVGSGIQARLQLQHIAAVTDCRQAIIWGRSENSLSRYASDMKESDFHITTVTDIDVVTDNCNLIITATPSTLPILKANKIKKGTHITAMGSDGSHKQELEESILDLADIVVADSIEQCLLRGEIYKALNACVIEQSKLVELGNVISGKSVTRVNDEQITIADLTGVAVQDIQIAKAVYNAV